MWQLQSTRPTVVVYHQESMIVEAQANNIKSMNRLETTHRKVHGSIAWCMISVISKSGADPQHQGQSSGSKRVIARMRSDVQSGESRAMGKLEH